MDIYILDDDFRRVDVIDVYDTMIWVDKSREEGTLELVVPWSAKNERRLVRETLLSIDDSHDVMEIQEVSIEDNEDNERIITVNGLGSDRILKQRIAKEQLGNKVKPPEVADADFDPGWVLSGHPADICRTIFTKICRDGVLSPLDVIQPFKTTSPYPAGTTPEPTGTAEVSFTTGNVYEVISQICETYEMGFRLGVDTTTREFFFEIFMGSDRTTSQTTLPAVVFSPQLENLVSTKEYMTMEDYFNVCYVISEDFGTTIVVDPNSDPTAKNFKRRVTSIDLGKIADDISDKAAYAQAMGLQALADAHPLHALDGEIPTVVKYKYNQDYFLMDLVELRSEDGIVNYMRVTENTIVSDIDGTRSYPTLTTRNMVTPGTWESWEYAIDWDDAYGTWDDQD